MYFEIKNILAINTCQAPPPLIPQGRIPQYWVLFIT